MNKQLMIIGGLLVLLVGVVWGVIGDVKFIVPVAYTTLTSTSTNMTLNFNQTTHAETNWNVTIYNRSSSTGTYGVINTNWNITNGTQESKLFTLVDGQRHWLFLNITNVTGGPVISTTRIIDTDVGFLTFQLGSFKTLNFTLDVGNITVAGWVHARNLSLIDSAGVTWLCGVNVTGRFACSVA